MDLQGVPPGNCAKQLSKYICDLGQGQFKKGSGPALGSVEALVDTLLKRKKKILGNTWNISLLFLEEKEKREEFRYLKKHCNSIKKFGEMLFGKKITFSSESTTFVFMAEVL